MPVSGLKSFYDSRGVPPETDFETDICIIGGGAAGITIAHGLRETGLRVLILESGGLEYEERVEDLGALSVVGHPYPRTGSRLRYFGGASNHWGGHCVPMRASVFEKRPWIPYSGWPFGLDVLDPYYRRAHEVIGLGAFDYDATRIANEVGQPLMPFDPRSVETVASRYNACRFGAYYMDDLDEAPSVSVLLYANVASINLNGDKTAVKDLTVRTLAGNGFTVRANSYVLATGGIENARLLLLSNQDMDAGVGNQNDLVGRFFQEHIWLAQGIIVPFDQNPERYVIYREEMPYPDVFAVRTHLAISEEKTRRLQIPEYRVELRISHSRRYYPATRSTARLIRSLVSLNLDEIQARDILTAASDPLSPISYTLGFYNAPLTFGFDNHVEQVPNPDSRIMLSDERDALGQRRAKMDWRLTSLDRDGIIIAQNEIARQVGLASFGRMRVYQPPAEDLVLSEAIGTAHHSGTTRMHDDPKQGVVDADCRVHGLGNIYVAGSSVFPICGFPNPTLTITALAIRLADLLAEKGRGVPLAVKSTEDEGVSP